MGNAAQVYEQLFSLENCKIFYWIEGKFYCVIIYFLLQARYLKFLISVGKFLFQDYCKWYMSFASLC